MDTTTKVFAERLLLLWQKALDDLRGSLDENSSLEIRVEDSELTSKIDEASAKIEIRIRKRGAKVHPDNYDNF